MGMNTLITSQTSALYLATAHGLASRILTGGRRRLILLLWLSIGVSPFASS
jgi:hypothetical protein